MRRLLVLCLSIFLIAAACGVGSSGDDLATTSAELGSGGFTASDGFSGGGDVAVDFEGAAPSSSPEAPPPVDLDLQPIGTLGRDIIKTGRVRTLVDDVAAAVNEVTVATEARSGFVFGRTVTLEGDRPSGEVVLKVPASAFDQLMSDLAKIGEVQGQESSAEDVTDQIVDLESRLTSARASVERVRGFLEAATNVDELARVEAELTRRESDLEALEGRLAVLKDQTSLSTITVSLSTDPTELVDDESEVDREGFAAGFDAGKDAFFGAARVVLAVIGFSLPFIPVLAAMAAIVWLLTRLRHRSDQRDGSAVVGAEA